MPVRIAALDTGLAKSTLAALTIAAAGTVGLVGPAQADITVPDALHGIWAVGACAAPDELLIYTPGGAVYLSFAEDFASAAQYVAIDGFADGWFGFREFDDTASDQYEFFARVQGGQLEEGWPIEGSATDPNALTDQDDLYTYSRCNALPANYALVFGEGLMFTSAIGTIAPTCTAGTVGDCVRGFVALADITGNGALSPAEVGRLIRMYAQHASLVEGTGIEDFIAGQAAAATIGVLAGQALVLALDYDGSGEVSAEELLAGRDAGVLDAQTLVAMDWRQDQIDFAAAAEALGDLFSGLDDAFMGLP